MKYDFVSNRITLIARVSGELDMLSADNFRQEIDIAMEKNCSNNLILNLEGVNFIDSSGLGVILGRYKKVSLRGGRMAIVGAPVQVKRILELSGVLGISKAYDNETEALQAM